MDDTLPTNPQGQAYKPATGEELPVEAQGRYADDDLEIGRGGIGRVVLRTDVLLGRQVAVKELLPEFQPARGSQAKDVADRFLNEARVTARLEHPGIVPVYEIGKRTDGSLYYAMKRVRGRTLEAALESCGTLADRLTLMQHVLDVVQTLAYAHSNGVIHRDLKPANIMVGQFGETQVLDWGLARVRGVDDVTTTGEPTAHGATSTSTQHGQLLGTPAYMSPEQAAGNNAAVDERSDVWCLGAIVFETLTGQSLFEAEDLQSMLQAVKVAPVRRVRQLEPDAPRALAEVADRALQRDPQKRFASAVEMAEELEHAMRRPTVGGRPLGLALTIAGLVGALLLVGAAWVSAQNDAEGARGFAEQAHEQGARAESALLARLAREELEKKDYAVAEALARQSLAAKTDSDPLARGIVALLESAARPTLRWEVKTPGCSTVTAERGLVACPTFGGVELRSAEDGASVRTLSVGPTGWQHVAAFWPDGTLITAGDDRLVHVWDGSSGAELAKWAGHQAPIVSLAVRGGTIVTGAMDGEVRKWDPVAVTSTLVAQHSGPVRALALSSNESIASSGPDGMKVWSLDKKERLVMQLDTPVQALLSRPRGLLVGLERSVFALELPDDPNHPNNPLTGLKFPTVVAALDEVTALASAPVASILVGDGRGRVRGFDAAGTQLWQLSGVERGVRGIAVDAADDSTGRLMVVASRGRQLQGWDLPEDPRVFLEQPAVTWGWQEGAPTARAAVLLGDRRGKVSNAAGAMLYEGPAVRVRALAGAQGKVLAGSEDGVVRLIASDDTKELARQDGHAVTAVAVAADGERAAFAFDDGTLVVHSVSLDREIASSRGSPAQVLAFSADGRWLAVGRSDRHVALLEAPTGKELALAEMKAVPSAFAFFGDRLAVGLERGAVLLDVASLKETDAFAGPNEPMRSLSFSIDGERLAGGSDDGQAYVWNVASRRLSHVLPVEAGDVMLVRFVDAEHLVVAGSDRSLRAVTIGQ